MTRRREWMMVTYTEQLQSIMQRLMSVLDRRTSLLESLDALWNEHHPDWFSRSGDRLPVKDFHTTMSRYLELFGELTGQTQGQRAILDDLTVSFQCHLGHQCPD